jgi:putative acetyltransferase
MNLVQHPMQIRKASLSDSESIKRVYIQAFDVPEGKLIANLAVNLLKEESIEKSISLVAVHSNEVVGHIAFSPVFLEANGDHFAYILAPLAVSPDNQKSGIGFKLVNHGLECVSNMGSYLVFVYGDFNYYDRFGFQTNLAVSFIPPYPLQYPDGWHALKIGDSCFPEGGRIKCVDSLSDPKLW